MSRSLKETNFHGTPMFPLQIYSHKDKNGFYSVTAHWHEELEFLYNEEGTMRGIISGTPYEMKAGEFYSSQTTSPMPSVRKNEKVSDSFFLQ